MRRRRIALITTVALAGLVLSACNFSTDRPDPIRLKGADWFPAQPELLSNDYTFDWRVEVRDSNGDRLNGSPLNEVFSGTMLRRYREVNSPSELLSPLYAVRDEHRPQESNAFVRSFQFGRDDIGQNWRWFSEENERLAGDSGVRLLRPQIAVGDCFEVQFDYPGYQNTWRTYAKVDVLRTEIVKTRMVDVEAFVVRIQGDDEDNGRFEGTDRYRFSKTLWVSPHVGVVQERWSIRKRQEQSGYHLHTIREYLLSSQPR